MQRSIWNKSKKIILIFIFFLLLIIIKPSVCFADFSEKQKQEIVNFANQVASMNTAYTTLDPNALSLGYELKETYGTFATDGYSGTYIWLCCATWVSTILNKCFGIEIDNRNATDGYATTDGWINPLFKDIDESELTCGDLVLWNTDGIYYGHIGMYLGNGLVTDCTDKNYNRKNLWWSICKKLLARCKIFKIKR